MHTAPYFTAFGFLTVIHAIRVIRLRWKHRVSIGDGGVRELELMMRVFGNHSEYVPIGLILLICLEFVQAPTWHLHLCGMTLLIGRILHAIGLPTGRPNVFRFIGMNLTFASILIASIGVMYWTFVVNV